ncbi:SIR2 family protein [Butyricicoccus sp.]|uniref:SIR2 family protein n=1 Tax=Butyricicoccus sp. TaxID=2049021 RepID=UPI003AACFE06
MILNSKRIIEELSKMRGTPITSEEEVLSMLKSDDNTCEEELLKATSEYRLKLGEHMKLDHVLFLFGNGASIYAGSKDTKEFHISDITKSERYNAIYEVLKSVDGLGMEEQLNRLIIIRAFFNITNNEGEPLVTQLIADIKAQLINNFVNSIDYRKLTYHQMLIYKLRNYGCLPRTKIFTTNYDLAFEHSLDALSVDYTDGFTGFVNRQFDPRTLINSAKATLIKIHGSVNWVEEETKIKELQPRFVNGKACIEDTKPVLIYPTSNKLYQTYSTPYSELMRYMLNEMVTERNVILVMGYKYGDEHINEILYKALQNPQNVFYFFQYGETIGCNFIDDMIRLSESMPNINVISGKILASFDWFVKFLLPATPEKSDEERALELLQKVFVKHE